MARLYRLALLLLSRGTRDQHGEQMAAVFADQVRDTRRRRGRLATGRLLAAELLALVRFAWCDRRGTCTPARIDERQLSWPLQPQGTTPMLISLAQDPGQGLAPVMVGLALGTAGALALTRFMETLLFGVAPTDALTFIAVVALLAATAAAAAYVPTRRATRVDPVRALRQE